MKVHIVVTDSTGNVFEGDAVLMAVAGGRRPPTQRAQRVIGPRAGGEPLDFSLPPRAFMRRYGRSVGGPAKFTLLLASLTKGEVGTAASLKDITKAWNRMTDPMGGEFNSAHPTRAKDNGWVDTPRHGSYVLRAGWTAAVGNE